MNLKCFFTKATESIQFSIIWSTLQTLITDNTFTSANFAIGIFTSDFLIAAPFEKLTAGKRVAHLLCLKIIKKWLVYFGHVSQN